MICFYTRSAKHLQINSNQIKNGSYFLKQFCDEELYLRLNESVENQDVWVISSTQSPAENLLELCFLLDALARNGANINVFFSYFGYERQDRIVEPFEALSAQVVSNFFRQFKINKILILHSHSERLHNFLSFQSVIPFDLYYPLINKSDVVIAPDKGAKIICEKIANECKKNFAWLEKSRPEQEKVQILKLNGDDVKDKSVLIFDDMITTGNTIINAADFLISKGAKSVDILATHSIFCDNAVDKINKSKIQNVYVTNSLNKTFSSNKIHIIDIAQFILDRINKI